jgi:phage terminase large subunit GpA-like protein
MSEPKEQLTVTEWANRNRWFAHGQSWKSQYADAPYDIRDAPFQQKPQDDLTDPSIFVHVWKMASRIAKTVMMGNGFGYFCEHDPSTQLFMYPTQEDADLRSREEFQPVIDVSPALSKYVYDAEVEGDDTIKFKKYPGGSVAFVGSNAPSKLRARTARVIWCDECNGYRPSAGKEGDAVMLAFNRAKNYENAVRVVASTDTIKHYSAIDDWYQKSDKNQWFVRCIKCGTWQFLTWKHYRWPGDERHLTLLHCENCDHGHNEKQRRQIILSGEYRPTAPFTGIRGYFLPGYYSIFPSPAAFKGKMHEMAEEAHNAKHSQNPSETLRVWVNTFLCEGYQEESDVPPEIQPLLDRREQYDRNTLPKGVKVITAGTDFQADRIEVVFWGHGDLEEKWRIEKQILWGDPRHPEIYGRLESLLLMGFKREDGAKLRLRSAGFDTGFAACIKQLYTWLRPRQRFNWFAFKGASRIEADLVGMAAKSRVSMVRLLLVGTHRIKGLIYNRVNITNIGSSYIHFPMSMTEQDFQQLFSEESTTVIKAGVEYKEFCLPSVGNRRNEELDCAVLAHAALYARGATNFDYEEKQNLKTVVEGNGQIKPQQRRPVRRVSSLVRSLTGSPW